MLYLDNAATTPLRAEVWEAMVPFLGAHFGNPSSQYELGKQAALALEEARSRVAAVLGMRNSDVIFTSGGTESNNLALKGIILAGGGRHLVTTPIEHESILESAAFLARVHGIEITPIPVDAYGQVAPGAIAAALREDTALVSLGLANNEVGTVQDAEGIAAVTRSAGVPLHLDVVQAAGWLPLAGLGADALSLAGHKIGAPKGTGVLAVRGRVPLEPLLHGGGQERGRRSGTENVAGAVGFAVALELAEKEQAEASARVGQMCARFVEAVLSAVPEARLTGHPTGRLPGTASFTLGGVSGESVLLELERRGVLASSGSACAAGNDDPSHVLLACGIRPEIAQTALRFTFGKAPVDPDALAATLADAVAAVTA